VREKEKGANTSAAVSMTLLEPVFRQDAARLFGEADWPVNHFTVNAWAKLTKWEVFESRTAKEVQGG
jgi:hypothetical protein